MLATVLAKCPGFRGFAHLLPHRIVASEKESVAKAPYCPSQVLLSVDLVVMEVFTSCVLSGGGMLDHLVSREAAGGQPSASTASSLRTERENIWRLPGRQL